MRIEFDLEADALYVRFKDERPADNVDIQEGITADFDASHRLIGIEILNVSRRLPPEALATITVQNLLPSTR
ncbi:MAG: DUF2283 domain-containing protein [Candidatus Omnitrophica bacterium]|nr:DUF2283 domain-containing protein [Candidatus Omnitrophota bacterium]